MEAIAKRGYDDHPCRGCGLTQDGCEQFCAILERWNFLSDSQGLKP